MRWLFEFCSGCALLCSAVFPLILCVLSLSPPHRSVQGAGNASYDLTWHAFHLVEQFVEETEAEAEAEPEPAAPAAVDGVSEAAEGGLPAEAVPDGGAAGGVPGAGDGGGPLTKAELQRRVAERPGSRGAPRGGLHRVLLVAPSFQARVCRHSPGRRKREGGCGLLSVCLPLGVPRGLCCLGGPSPANPFLPAADAWEAVLARMDRPRDAEGRPIDPAHVRGVLGAASLALGRAEDVRLACRYVAVWGFGLPPRPRLANGLVVRFGRVVATLAERHQICLLFPCALCLASYSQFYGGSLVIRKGYDAKGFFCLHRRGSSPALVQDFQNDVCITGLLLTAFGKWLGLMAALHSQPFVAPSLSFAKYLNFSQISEESLSRHAINSQPASKGGSPSVHIGKIRWSPLCQNGAHPHIHHCAGGICRIV